MNGSPDWLCPTTFETTGATTITFQFEGLREEPHWSGPTQQVEDHPNVAHHLPLVSVMLPVTVASLDKLLLPFLPNKQSIDRNVSRSQVGINSKASNYRSWHLEQLNTFRIPHEAIDCRPLRFACSNHAVVAERQTFGSLSANNIKNRLVE